MTRRAEDLDQLGRDFKKWGKIYYFVMTETARLGGGWGTKTTAIEKAAGRFGKQERGIQKILAHFEPWEALLKESKEIFDRECPEIQVDRDRFFVRFFCEHALGELPFTYTPMLSPEKSTSKNSA